MRLTIINQFYAPDTSPTAQLCASLAEHRGEVGDEVTVLCSRAGYMTPVSAPGAEANGQARVCRLISTRFGSRTPVGRLLDWMSFHISALATAIAMPPQDLIIAMTTPPFIALAALAHLAINPRCRLILWSMDVYPEALERTGLIRPRGTIARAMRWLNRRIFARLDGLAALDPAMMDLLLSQYTPRQRFVPRIIANWENAALFPEPAPAMVRNQKLVVLYLGNAGYGHHFATVLDAAERLRDQSVEFVFVGGGALRPWIEQQAQARNLRNIVLRDYVPKSRTPEVMASADLALITLDDAMLGVMSPSKLHACVAMGLPILYVGPAGSNVDEAIRYFRCGVSLRVGDAAGMTDAILKLLREPNDLAPMRAAARRAFEEAYCDRVALEKFDETIDRVMALGADAGDTTSTG